MVITELKTEEEIQSIISLHWHADNDAFLSPVFHGTDALLFCITPKERTEIEEACDVIITSLVRVFMDNAISFNDKRLKESIDERGDARGALVKAQGRINKSGFYNYEYFFVSNNPQRAISYSNQAWIYGESGWVANRLLEAARTIDLDLPDNDLFNRSMYLINKRKQLKDDPMVLMLVDVDSAGVCLENGVEIKPNSDTDRFSFTLSDIKKHSVEISLRLKKTILESVDCVYAVKRSNYDKLMDAWNRMNV